MLSTQSRIWVFYSLVLVTFSTAVEGTGVGMVLPYIQEDFALNQYQQQWILISYLLGLSSYSLFLPLIVRTFGLRRTYIGGVALFAIGSVACATAPIYGLLLLYRYISGAGAAFILALSFNYVENLYRGGDYKRMTGMFTTGMVVVAGFAPLVAGLFISYFSWRGFFVSSVAFVLPGLAVILFYKINEENYKEDYHVIPFYKALNFVSSYTIFIYFLMLMVYEDDIFTIPNVALFLLSIALLLPLIDPPAIRKQTRNLDDLKVMLVFSTIYVTLSLCIWLPVYNILYMDHVYGLDTIPIAVIISVSMFFAATVPFFSSRLEKKYSSPIVVLTAVLAMAIAAANIYLATFINVYYYTFALILFGMASAPVFSGIFNCVTDHFGDVKGLKNVANLVQVQTAFYVLEIPFFGYFFYGHLSRLEDTAEVDNPTGFLWGYRNLIAVLVLYFLFNFVVFYWFRRSLAKPQQA